MIDDTLGKYQIRRELGRGGMAAVYEAFDPTFDRVVALKMLPPELLHDATFRARFEREAKTIAALEHPAIVPVYDYGEANGKVFFVMRYMGGGSLADRMQSGAMAPLDIARIYDRLAPALDRAHAKGVVHRDLKPGNILFDDNGEPYVSDFGIAKLSMAANTELTQGGAIGTPSYMSPEQARGERLDGRSDIYAMGVMLFEVLAGGLPYRSETPTGMMMKHILDPVPRLAERVSGLPGAWQAIIDRAMAKSPEDRYANMASMANDIRAVAEGRSLTATPPMESPSPLAAPTQVFQPAVGSAAGVPAPIRVGTPLRPIPPVAAPAALPARRVSPLVIVGGVAAAFVVIGGGLALTGVLGGSRPAAPTAAPPAMTTSPTAVMSPAPSVTIAVTAPSLSPSPTVVPAATPVPAATRIPPTPTTVGPAGSSRSTLDAATVAKISELSAMPDSADAPVRSVSFSADGEQIIATLGNTPNQATADNRAQIWRRSTGATVKRVGIPSIPWSGDLSPDGSAILVAAGKTAALYRVADGVATRQVATVALEMVQAVFSPNGKYAAAGGVDVINRTPIQVFATDTWTRVAAVDNGYNMSNLRFSADGSLIAASNSIGQVTVWRVADGRRVMSYKFDASGVSVPVAFSPDGKYFVAAACTKTCAGADQNSEVRLWSTGDWSVAAAFKETNNPIEAVGIPLGGDILFMGGRTSGKFVRIQDALANVSVLSYRHVGVTGITCVDFSADGRFAAIGTSSSGVRLWGVP